MVFDTLPNAIESKFKRVIERIAKIVEKMLCGQWARVKLYNSEKKFSFSKCVTRLVRNSTG